jgi:hypothetical protein
MRLREKLGAALLLCTIACLPRGPVVDTGPKPEGVGGTISGTVRASQGAVPLGARKVTAINVETGARYEASTSAGGGYTIKVPRGKYRVEVELQAGETLANAPAETEINVGDVDAQRNFEVTIRR